MGDARNGKCLNCGTHLGYDFCGKCGQRNVPPRMPLWRHLGDLLGTQFALDSRIARTIPTFLFRPGVLTRAFNDGRRMRYSSPLRLYLVTSLLLFLGLSIARVVDDVVELRTVSTNVPAMPAGELAALGGYALDEEPVAFEESISEVVVAILGESHPLSLLIREKTERLRTMEWSEARLAGIDNWLNLLPTAMFLLLPLVAAALKLCLLGTGRYYTEHLVFTLHLHAFFFTLLLTLAWAWAPVPLLIAASLAVLYGFVGLRNAYRLSLTATAVRGVAFAALYLALLVGGLGTTFAIALMSV